MAEESTVTGSRSESVGGGVARQPQRPLEGVRVADFSWYGAGPIAGRALALGGADVIRVESEARPDGLRQAPPTRPGVAGYNVSGFYNNFNPNKRSFPLNLAHPRALPLALAIIAKCDVLLENYTPRVMANWGLTDEAIFAANPRIVAVHLPMQGSDGPHRDFLGFGAVLTPLAGFSHLTGFPYHKPIGLGTNYPDYVLNPGHATVAILAALRAVRRSGRGQRIEVAQLESSASVFGPQIMDWLANGRVAGRDGNRHPAAAPHGAYPCAGEDRWCVIAVLNDEQWLALRGALGDPAWAAGERFATLSGRKAHEDELDERLGTWTRERAAEDVMALLQAKGVPAGVVQTPQDVLDRDAHLRERGYYVYLDHPEAGRTAYDGAAFRLSRTPCDPVAPAPCLAQDLQPIARDLLGLSDEQIAELIIEQVLY